MSHFTVLIIGDNPEELLAPFDEGIQVEPYEDEELDPAAARDWAQKVVDDPSKISDSWRKPSPEEVEAQLQEYKEFAALDPSDEKDAARLLEWYGGHTPADYVRKSDGRYVRLSRYNPKSKWDWYQLGGRWRGSLKVTETAWTRMTTENVDSLGEKSWTFLPEYNNGRVHTDEPMWVDTCLKGDLDLEGMAAEQIRKAKLAISRLVEFIAENGQPPSAEWMDKLDRGELHPKSEEFPAIREAFWRGPWMSKFNKLAWDARSSKTDDEDAHVGLGLDTGWWNVDDFRLVTENADGAQRFLDSQLARAVPGFAMLDAEHGWMEPGKMGWWGMSTDTAESRDAFRDVKLKLVKELPDATRLSVYDCHI
jgi:hypothetical protein